MDFKIQNLYKEKIDEVVKLIDKMVGKGLYTKEVLEKSIKNENHFFKVVSENEKIIAYLYYIIITAREYKIFSTEIKPAEFLKSLDDDIMICTMQSIGIYKNNRGFGLSDILVQSGISAAQKLNCKCIVVYAWEYNGNIPAKSLLERNGFSYKETIERAWENIKSLRCDQCCSVPCSCNAKLFVREL